MKYLKSLGIFVLSVTFVVVVYRCTKEQFTNNETNDVTLKSATQQNDLSQDIKMRRFNYDHGTQRIAFAVAKALKNIEFRKHIKDEASKKVDGDFEILLKDVVDQNVKGTSKKFKSYLAESSQANDRLKLDRKTYDFRSFKDNFIDSVKKDIPKLIIAVRGPVENWDPDTYQPLVVYLHSGFKESDKTINAIDKDGNIVPIDLSKKPENPVVVVMMSERHDENGNLKTWYNQNTQNNTNSLKSAKISVNSVVPSLLSTSETSEPLSCTSPQTPANLTATQVQSGIRLTWTNPTNYNLMYVIHEIQRNDGSGYFLLINLYGDETEWIDTYNMTPLKQYFYKVRVIYKSKQGNCYSSWAYCNATSGNAPSAITNFTVNNASSSQMELNWTNNTSEFRTGTKIERFIAGFDAGYKLINTVTSDKNGYVDLFNDISYASHLIKYRVTAVNNFGYSNSVYDSQYNPYRNNGEPLVINSMHIDDVSAVESWLRGDPDFLLTVATMNSLTDGDAVKIKDKLALGYNTRDNDCEMNHVLCYWYNTFYKSVMSFHLLEEDDDIINGNCSISLTVKAPVKTPLGEITIDGKANITINFDGDDEDCGTAYHMYWEFPGRRLDFGYGVKMYLSRIDEP